MRPGLCRLPADLYILGCLMFDGSEGQLAHATVLRRTADTTFAVSPTR